MFEYLYLRDIRISLSVYLLYIRRDDWIEFIEEVGGGAGACA